MLPSLAIKVEETYNFNYYSMHAVHYSKRTAVHVHPWPCHGTLIHHTCTPVIDNC